VDALKKLGFEVHDLVKLPDDGNPATQEDSTVYYLGADGRRHAFPNSAVYFSWYCGFGGVKTITIEKLSQIPLGRNAAYRPGLRLVKFPSIPTVYLVQTGGILSAVPNEATAIQILGTDWNRHVSDISEAFYQDYVIDGEVSSPFDLRAFGQTPETISGNLNFDGYSEKTLMFTEACPVSASAPAAAPAPTSAETHVWPYSDIPKDFSFNSDLSQSEGSPADVRYLQSLLKSLGTQIYPEGLVTGLFGPATASAVSRFQEQKGLPTVGRVGPATRSELNAILDSHR
jgi:hypothetical protein